MKRWVLFLVLFLAGLGVLWWIDSGRAPRTPPPGPDGASAGRTPADALTDVPVAGGQVVKGETSGPFSSSTFDPATGKVLYRITARDHRSLGNGVYRFEKLVGRFFAAGTDQVRLEVAAETARGRLTSVPTLDFDRSFPVELDDVVATLREGSPFVPLTLRVPHATGNFAAETFASTDRVDIAGSGLSADGVGLSFDGKAKEIRLERDTHAKLALEDGTPAALSAAGGLSFTSLEKLGEGASRVVAREKAHLTFEGLKPLVVDADSIELDALVLREPATRVLPTRISAHGSVRLAPVDGKFFGDDAELQIGEDGLPTQATLLGTPRVELLLRGVDTAAVPGGGGPTPTDLEVQLVGAGPLDVRLAGEAHFDFHGPATLLLPALDMNLTAQEKLSGTRRGEGAFGRLDALGAVEARWAGSVLTSDALVIERKLTKDGVPAASMISPGPARVHGPLEGTGAFDFTAAGSLEFVRHAKSFQVPLARDVDLVVTGPDAFHAKADELRDLDELTRSFVGIGNVSFESEQGRGRGERIIARGRDSAELIGAPTAPAHCDVDQGWLEARAIVFDVDRLRAEGEARAQVGLDGARYDLGSRWVSLLRQPAQTGETLLLEAGGDVAAHLEDGARMLDVSAESLEARAFSPGNKLEALESRGLVASGGVVFRASGEQELSGEGERLVIEADRSGSLYPAEGQRVQLRGKLPKDALTFDMGAGVVSFSPTSLSAEDPVIELEGVDVPFGKARGTERLPLRAVAGAISVDPTSILFSGGVYLGQSASQETAWSLDAENLVLLGGAKQPSDGSAERFEASSVLAWGGFQARFAEAVHARGSTLLLDRDQDRLTIRGEPCEFDYAGMRLSTVWLEFELSTGFWRAAQGTLTPLDERHGSYSVSFASMEPLYGSDSRVEVIREIRYVNLQTQREVRASWAVLWIDAHRLAQLLADLMPNAGVARIELPDRTAAPAAPRNEITRHPLMSEITGWVKELYLEGNVEVIEPQVRKNRARVEIRRSERVIRADAMYVNLVDGHAWFHDLEATVDLPLNAAADQMTVHADWMRYAPDGSIRASQAVATTCVFDKPHYEVTLGDLRVERRPTAKARKAIEAGRSEGASETEGFAVRSTGNSVRFGRGPNIPLGPLSFVMDDNYKIDEDSASIFGLPMLVIGSSAKYGLFIGTSFALPLGWVSARVNSALGKGPRPDKQRSIAHVKYLNRRGLLVGATNRVEETGVYRIRTDLSLIYDTGRDRGLVRVPDGERDDLRSWLRIEGRRLFGDGEWLDIHLTQQSDAGVQSEFFESDFLRWEARESYLHWRRARGLDYSRATVEAQLDDHRTEIVESPSLGYTRARAGVVRWWGRELVYSSDTTLARMLRLEGDLRLDPLGNRIIEDPFGAQIVDGFGEEEALRLDSTQRWELPLPLGALNARLVPFVMARGTIWDRGAAETEAPTRAGLIAGAEASTTFWRMYGDGDLHSLTPTLGIRSDIHVEESGPTPAQFDGVEDPIDGTIAEVGLRSRWVKPSYLGSTAAEERFLDIELRQAYAGDLSGGRDEGWQPLRLNAQWLSEVADIPFGMRHDARYDVEAGDAVYSRSLVDVRPVPSVMLETGFHSAQDLTGGRLYSAWSLGARYDFSEKWQFEGKETISSLSGSQLGSSFLLRRVGHDFIFELQYSFVAGEGGGSVSFTLIPMLAYRERRFGRLDAWQREGN